MLLARTWFHCTPTEVLQRCTSRELSEMQADYDLRPWCEEANETRAATVGFASVKGMTESISFSEFMPPWYEPPEQTPEDMRRALAATSTVEKQ